jgi:hypothetical protein
VLVEYMYLGQGRTRAEHLDFNDRLGLIAGEVLSISRHTVFFAAAQDLGPRFAAGVRGTAIPMDPVNVVFFPFVAWRMFEGASLESYATVPVGSQRGVIGASGPGFSVWLRFDAGAHSS